MTSINWSNVTNFEDILAGANTTTDGTFWGATLYLLFFVLAISMSRFGVIRAVLSASAIGLVLGLPLVFLGLVNMLWIAPFFSMIVISILYAVYTKN